MPDFDEIRRDAAEAERIQIWSDLKPYWHGDMGPAYILVTDLEAALNRK